MDTKEVIFENHMLITLPEVNFRTYSVVNLSNQEIIIEAPPGSNNLEVMDGLG